jgi:hypothetical protein
MVIFASPRKVMHLPELMLWFLLCVVEAYPDHNQTACIDKAYVLPSSEFTTQGLSFFPLN